MMPDQCVDLSFPDSFLDRQAHIFTYFFLRFVCSDQFCFLLCLLSTDIFHICANMYCFSFPAPSPLFVHNGFSSVLHLVLTFGNLRTNFVDCALVCKHFASSIAGIPLREWPPSTQQAALLKRSRPVWSNLQEWVLLSPVCANLSTLHGLCDLFLNSLTLAQFRWFGCRYTELNSSPALAALAGTRGTSLPTPNAINRLISDILRICLQGVLKLVGGRFRALKYAMTLAVQTISYARYRKEVAATLGWSGGWSGLESAGVPGSDGIWYRGIRDDVWATSWFEEIRAKVRDRSVWEEIWLVCLGDAEAADLLPPTIVRW
jgi:hypothetical protein